MSRLIIGVAWLIGLFGWWLVGPLPAQAISTQMLENAQSTGGFAVSPGKVDLFLAPGAREMKKLLVTNTTGFTADFSIDIEDFKGDEYATVKLLGDERGPYSLRDYLHPEVRQFTLAHGQRITVPIEIAIPADAEPGGLYGSVIVRAHVRKAVDDGKNGPTAAVGVSTRLATLYFVRVKGPVKQEGGLTSFAQGLDGTILEHGPVSFNLAFDNKGSIHLSPYGLVTIRNMTGVTVAELPVSAFFVLPGMTRSRDVVWEQVGWLGRYTAELNLHRAYKDATDVVDTKSVTFYVIPYKLMGAGFIGLILFFWIIKRFFGKFQFKIQRRG